MEIAVDGMLGKLARWLRMLGFDTKYFNNVSDDDILRISSEENRIILTRDYQFFKKANARGVRAIFVEGKTHVERLANLSKHLGIKLEIDLERSRCPKCNARIKPVSKEEIKDRVPASTYKIYNEFWICSGCGQVYWKGSHWKKINNTLTQARQLAYGGSS
ncbi:MAG: Mut7-C RNAse domain-containing protein [Candidatus Bathyarchaeia archaeon]